MLDQNAGTRELLEHMLNDEEESIDWLEAQLKIVGDIGRERYLSEQLHSGGYPSAPRVSSRPRVIQIRNIIPKFPTIDSTDSAKNGVPKRLLKARSARR